jgi:hypothetical protein
VAKQFLNQQKKDHQARGNIVKMTIVQILDDFWAHGKAMLRREQ